MTDLEMYESFPGIMADELISWYKKVTPIIKEIVETVKELLKNFNYD